MTETDTPAAAPPRRHIGWHVFWVTILVGLTALFSYWIDALRNPNRAVRSTVNGERVEIVLERNRQGHYHLTGFINGREVEFLLDTGATVVSVPQSVANELNLPRGTDTPVHTANGVARAWLTRLDSVRLGEIELRDVRAHINPGLTVREVLLGMSVLKQLDFSQRGNTLTLTQQKHETSH
jgi:aspartyl protease family protein